jgi:hypothetical protein
MHTEEVRAECTASLMTVYGVDCPDRDYLRYR